MIERMAQLQDEYVSALECATRIKAAMGQTRPANGLGDAYLSAKAALEAITRELRAEVSQVPARIEAS